MPHHREWKEQTLFEADCYCCIIQVEGWYPYKDDPGWAFVFVSQPGERVRIRKLRTRLKRAWEGLSGKPNDSIFFYEVETIDKMIDALTQARAIAWSEPALRL